MSDANIRRKRSCPVAKSVWANCPNSNHNHIPRLIRMCSHSLILGLLAFLLVAPSLTAAQSPPSPGTASQNAQADDAMRSRDYPRAIALYQAILRDQPADANVLLHLAKAYLLSRQFRAAIAAYQLVLHQDPNNVAALTGAGQAYNFLGDYANAERSLQQGLKISPDNPDAAWSLSRTYLYESRLEPAEQLLKFAVVAHPRDFRLWESLGEVQLHQGRAADACVSLQRALALNPKAERARILLNARELPKSPMRAPALKVDFHDYFYWLSDGVGNQVFTMPQSLRLTYGRRWSNDLTANYLRASHRSGDNLRSTGITSLTDSAELRINSTLTVIGGGGVARYLAQGISRPVYHGGIKFSPVSRMELSYSYGQRMVAPTQLAATLALTRRGWSSQFRYSLPRLTSFRAGYFQDEFSDSNRTAGGRAEIRQVLWEKPLQVSVGYQFESLSFSRLDLFHGYFSPKRFIAHTALVNFKGQKGGFHYDYDLDVGAETYTRPVLLATTPLSFVIQRRTSPRFIALLRNSYEFNPQWSLQFSVLLYRSALSSGTGAYQAHAFLFGLNHRF